MTGSCSALMAQTHPKLQITTLMTFLLLAVPCLPPVAIVMRRWMDRAIIWFGVAMSIIVGKSFFTLAAN